MQLRALCLDFIFLSCLPIAALSQATMTPRSSPSKIENTQLSIEVSKPGDSYTIRSRETSRVSLTARVAAQVDHRWISSADYPRHEVTQSFFDDHWPDATAHQSPQLTVTHAGRSGDPDLICQIRLHSQPASAEIEVRVRNTRPAPISVQSLRLLDAVAPVVNLDGPPSSDRILSDSFSEDRPDMEIHDAMQPENGLHLAVGSQLIYNRSSRQSLFIGALTSEKWLTVLHLHLDPKQEEFTGYQVDSEGTTELEKQNSLRNSPKEDQIELSLPVPSGQSISSERVLLSLSGDYHAQLESYGRIIRDLHHARIIAPTPIGWWSWTAYYFGITAGTALTNAQVLSANLKAFGYKFFHIDEGYQYARGDYTSPVAHKFPDGMRNLEDQVRTLGLAPGIWTAPFEVSERSSIYADHKDWLVHNAQGAPIHAGIVTEPPDTQKPLDPLYVLDVTNPAAQHYIRNTYRTLTQDWGIRYIKLDFMDDTAIEGNYFRPNTTAMEAQRIGLQLIREAVGDGVLLDKDGSVMLNPVGLVDIGRISSDTGHSFDASRSAAPGIASRYYMNRNFFVSDPDAFTVSRQLIGESQNHGALQPLTLDEAKVSIALSAISGGLFGIGDDLSALFADADRMALVRNTDLLNMARFGHAATPLDLMTYAPEDQMPSVFLLQQSQRQSILAIFNWTDQQRSHQFTRSDLRLQSGPLALIDVFDPDSPLAVDKDFLRFSIPPRSVRVVKIVNTRTPAIAPSVTLSIPLATEAGKPAIFSATPSANGIPALAYRWNFGDGTIAEGTAATHTFTHAANYEIHLSVDGIDGLPFEKSFPVKVTGAADTIFRPELYLRYEEK